jgi:LPS export ABC transporter protein LptC
MNWQLLIIAAICAVLFGGYSIFTKREEVITNTTTSAPQPGYYMNDASIIETGTDGKTRLALHAGSITQDVSHHNILLNQVDVNYLGTTQTPWLLTAQTGRLEQDTRVVTFNGDVLLQPTGSNITLPISLRTEQLSIDTVNNIAKAPGKVSITMNKQLLTAVGLHADLQRQTIRLESQVHGEFVAH